MCPSRYKRNVFYHKKGSNRLKTSKLKSYLISVLIVLTFIACTKEDNKIKVLKYNTPAFKQYIKNAPISLDKAWELQLKYLSDVKKEKVGSPLFFIINDKYLFTPYYNPKTPEVRIEGVVIDSRTGEAGYMSKTIKLKPTSQFGWTK